MSGIYTPTIIPIGIRLWLLRANCFDMRHYRSPDGEGWKRTNLQSQEGNAMLLVSWKEMRDVANGKSEARKVAKSI
jgi:hypothetical protein